MSYIGRGISNLSDRTVLDSITASATATYNLLLNTVAYVPSSAESLTVSLNGVIQKPVNSYTVSGSTIVFASSLASTDSIDFILAERAITLTTIGSGTVTTSNIVDANVTTAKIADNAVTSAKLDSGLALGKIGQVTSTSFTLNTSVTSTSLVELNSSFRLTLTPSSTSSKFLYQFQCTQFAMAASRGSFTYIYKSVGGGAYSDASGKLSSYTGYENSSNYSFSSMSYLDSPSTTSAVIYTPYVNVSSSEIRFGDNAKGFATLMEVLA